MVRALPDGQAARARGRGRSLREPLRRCRSLLVPVALAAFACVSGERGAMNAARARYERCVEAANERACAAERERMLSAERTYQERAQRAWGCDPSEPDCPPDR